MLPKSLVCICGNTKLNSLERSRLIFIFASLPAWSLSVNTISLVIPVFNKSDMFYAAKKGGPLDNALEHVLDILKSLQSEKNQPVILSTNEIEFGTTVQESLMKIRRRPI